MSVDRSKTRVTTPPFRVSYPNVFKPKRNDLNGKDEFSVVALFEKGADLKPLANAVRVACEIKWGADSKKWPPNLKSPFRDQGDRAKEDPETGKRALPDGYVEGAKYLNLKSTNRPGVVDAQVQPILDETQFYGGCYARATIEAFAYDQKGNKGVSFGLRNLQKVKDGDPFGSRRKAEDDFAPIEGVSSDSDDAVGDMFK